MKKHLSIILVFFLAIATLHAQNYQCLQSGVKHYFTNANGYLRGIRIDSIRTNGDTTIYYPFHTPRGPWASLMGGVWATLDSTAGCWLGKKDKQLSDGTFLFDNYWGDTVIIKPQANLTGSWLFYRNTSGLYYKATVTAIDTMTFLGIFDSVKTITINAYFDSVLVTTDSLNGFQLVLSKNNGFVQVFDLYMFPYHPADSVYISGRDFYLDVSLDSATDNYYFWAIPGVVNSIYKPVTFLNPNYNQLYASNIGDVYEIYYYGSYSSPMSIYLDTIITKTILSHGITYSYRGLQSNLIIGSGPPYYLVSDYAGSYTTNDSTYLVDTSNMPEEMFPSAWGTGCNYYFPNDSSYCTVSPLYISGWVFPELPGNGFINTYKIGFGYMGNGNIHSMQVTDNPSYWDDTLIYTYKNGISCGSYDTLLLPSYIPILPSQTLFTIFPNPATTSITIQSTTQPINQIIITNLLGQTIYTQQQTTAQQQTIDVSTFPTGIYFIKINGTEVRKFVKE